MNTMIISAFPACGKTYLYENQDELIFKYHGKNRKFSFFDFTSSDYKKDDGWEKQYVSDLEKKIGTVDFLFISQYEEILQELNERNIPFSVVAPSNSEWISDNERQLIKQQWFGRFILRDNSHIKNFEEWLELLKNKYDEWTSVDHLTKYNPASFFLLDGNQYLSDIIKDLYWKKENNPNLYCKIN